MKLSEGFEYKGYWWRPSAPDKKVAGVLTYKAGDKILLELIGAFGGSEDAITAFMNKRDEDIIYGTLENAKNVTLVRCFCSGSINLSCPFPIIRYSCAYCVIGRHYKSMDVEGNSSMTVHFPEMPYWCHPTSVQRNIE